MASIETGRAAQQAFAAVGAPRDREAPRLKRHVRLTDLRTGPREPKTGFPTVVSKREDSDTLFPLHIDHVIWEPIYRPASRRNVVRNIEDALADRGPTKNLLQRGVNGLDEFDAEPIPFSSRTRERRLQVRRRLRVLVVNEGSSFGESPEDACANFLPWLAGRLARHDASGTPFNFARPGCFNIGPIRWCSLIETRKELGGQIRTLIDRQREGVLKKPLRP
jgi:hypothetical protein